MNNVVKNIGAGSWGRLSTILFKLCQVPLLLSYLSTEDYGRWLILYSLPSWLAYASQGFGSVAANEIPISVAAGKLPVAQRVYATSFAFMVLLTVGGMLLTLTVAPLIPWDRFLELEADRQGEVVRAVVCLALAVFLSFFSELFYGRFRAAQLAHRSILITSFQNWIELLFLFVALQFTTALDHLAYAMVAAICVYLLAYGWLSYRAYSRLRFRWKLVRVREFRVLFFKGFAFQAFPLGNALLFQGNLLAVQLMLGPTAVALFGTARTLVRVVNQALELISKSIWPELSYLFGAGKAAGVRRLHRLGLGLCVTLSVLGVGGLSLLGGWLYQLWVGESIALPHWLLLLFLLPIPFNALWLTSSTVLMASNQHTYLARRYLLATTTAAIGCAVLTYFFGLGGAAVSTLIADLILIPYVVTRVLELTDDTLGGLLSGAVEQTKAVCRQALHTLRPAGTTE